MIEQRQISDHCIALVTSLSALFLGHSLHFYHLACTLNYTTVVGSFRSNLFSLCTCPGNRVNASAIKEIHGKCRCAKYKLNIDDKLANLNEVIIAVT